MVIIAFYGIWIILSPENAVVVGLSPKNSLFRSRNIVAGIICVDAVKLSFDCLFPVEIAAGKVVPWLGVETSTFVPERHEFGVPYASKTGKEFVLTYWLVKSGSEVFESSEDVSGA